VLGRVLALAPELGLEQRQVLEPGLERRLALVQAQVLELEQQLERVQVLELGLQQQLEQVLGLALELLQRLAPGLELELHHRSFWLSWQP
jgi:hypothetical protein